MFLTLLKNFKKARYDSVALSPRYIFRLDNNPIAYIFFSIFLRTMGVGSECANAQADLELGCLKMLFLGVTGAMKKSDDV